MSDDLANPILGALTAARQQLRDCYWWRRLASEASPWSESQADEHIYDDELPPPSVGPNYSRDELTKLRPFALLWLDPANGMTLTTESNAGCCWTTRGIVTILLEIAVPDTYQQDPAGLAFWLQTKLGRIIRTCDEDKPGLADLAGLPGYLPLSRIQFRGYVRADSTTATTQGDFVLCELELEWGNT